LQRQEIKPHVLVKDLEEFRFTQLLPERKYFLDTIKMWPSAFTSKPPVRRQLFSRPAEAARHLRV
jgi:hypothetical protein